MSVTTEGEIRPNSNPTPKALEKRVRRKFAADGMALQRTRAGSIARAEHGEWLVIAPRTGEIIRRDVTLAELAADLGLLADDEVVGGDA